MKALKPIILTDKETNKTYTLQFNRDAIRYAEMNGFSVKDIEQVEDCPMTVVPKLFYYAFHMNHKEMTQQETDEILFDKLGGLNEKLIARLVELFAEPYATLMSKEGYEKNAKMTVHL